MLDLKEGTYCYIGNHKESACELFSALERTDAWKYFSQPNFQILVLVGNRVLKKYRIHVLEDSQMISAGIEAIKTNADSASSYRIVGDRQFYQYFMKRVAFSGGRIILHNEYDNYPTINVPWQGIDSLFCCGSSLIQQDFATYPVGYLPKSAISMRGYVMKRFPCALQVLALARTPKKQDELEPGVYQVSGSIRATLPLEFDCSYFNDSSNADWSCREATEFKFLFIHKSPRLEDITSRFDSQDGFIRAEWF